MSKTKLVVCANCGKLVRHEKPPLGFRVLVKILSMLSTEPTKFKFYCKDCNPY